MANHTTQRRIQELERAFNPPAADDDRIIVRYAHFWQLPHTYRGERHERLVKGFPSEATDTDCVIQEYPGPGPKLKFDFGTGKTILVHFVESDGDSHPKGYWPDDVDRDGSPHEGLRPHDIDGNCGPSRY